MEIILNGRKRKWPRMRICYSDVAFLAYPGKTKPARLRPSTTFFNADQEPAEGILSPGKSIKLKEGTRINCTITDKA